jgi:hypothetical protein
MPNKAPEQKKKEESKPEVLKVALVTTAKSKPAKSKEAGAVIRTCSCLSAFQDARYGRGRRVFTASKKNGMTCTVCGRKN